jgi:hypothetical protein
MWQEYMPGGQATYPAPQPHWQITYVNVVTAFGVTSESVEPSPVERGQQGDAQAVLRTDSSEKEGAL